MPKYVENSSIISFFTTIPIESTSAFADWQAELSSKVAIFPGFVSLEFLSSGKEPLTWHIIQRFSNQDRAVEWLASPIKLELVNQLKQMSAPNGFKESLLEDFQNAGATEIFLTKVLPSQEDAYRIWNAQIHKAEARFPGFRGVYIQAPSNTEDEHWITLLQFDKFDNLDRWLNSSERKELLEQSKGLILSLENHRVISPYVGWFASIARIKEIPPLWKQTMIILLVLFPIVMLEFKYLSPLIKELNLSLGTFIGNALSVTLISFPAMPIAIRALGWWLSPHAENSTQATFWGTLLVLILYVVEIAFFWKFL